MGYTNSTVHGIPVPNSAQANNVPNDLQGIVDVLETGSLVKRLSSTAIGALTSGQKPAGLVVYNTTTNKLQISNGSAFADVDAASLLLSGGTMAGAIAMGSNKITGLADGTVSTDAAAYGQVTALGTYSAWTPSIAVGSGSITASPTTSENRYTQIGKHVSGRGHMKITAASGSANLRIPLPVTPTSTSAIARRIGMVQIFSAGKGIQGFLEQSQSNTYCSGVYDISVSAGASFMTATLASTLLAIDSANTFITWDFHYEAA